MLKELDQEKLERIKEAAAALAARPELFKPSPQVEKMIKDLRKAREVNPKDLRIPIDC